MLQTGQLSRVATLDGDTLHTGEVEADDEDDTGVDGVGGVAPTESRGDGGGEQPWRSISRHGLLMSSLSDSFRKSQLSSSRLKTVKFRGVLVAAAARLLAAVLISCDPEHETHILLLLNWF